MQDNSGPMGTFSRWVMTLHFDLGLVELFVYIG